MAEEAIAATPLPKLRRGGSLLPAENAKARAFSDEEIAGFWSRIDQTGMDIRTRTALKLVALTAMRPGEVLGLRRRDVDLSATFVDRRGGTERVRGNGLVTLRDTKNGLTRFIPLSPGGRALAAEALRSVSVGRDAFLFPANTADGKAKPMETQALARAMSRRRDLFGEEMTPHRLRAMAAFLVEKLGFGSAVARDVLGHIDGSVLRRNYSGFDGLPARLDALEAVAIEIERLSGAQPDGGKRGGGGSRAAETETLLMGFDEAVEALKTRDPRLVVQLAELCAAVDAAKGANDPTSAWNRMESAIVALLKSTGADDQLFERQVKEGHDAAGAGIGEDDTGKSRRRQPALLGSRSRLPSGGYYPASHASYRHCGDPSRKSRCGRISLKKPSSIRSDGKRGGFREG